MIVKARFPVHEMLLDSVVKKAGQEKEEQKGGTQSKEPSQSFNIVRDVVNSLLDQFNFPERDIMTDDRNPNSIRIFTKFRPDLDLDKLGKLISDINNRYQKDYKLVLNDPQEYILIQIDQAGGPR